MRGLGRPAADRRQRQAGGRNVNAVGANADHCAASPLLRFHAVVKRVGVLHQPEGLELLAEIVLELLLQLLDRPTVGEVVHRGAVGGLVEDLHAVVAAAEDLPRHVVGVVAAEKGDEGAVLVGIDEGHCSCARR